VIYVIHGKRQYGEKAAKTLFGDLVSPSQEAFTLLLYRNGYQNWVWMHNESILLSEASEDSTGNFDGTLMEGSPGYLYTVRTIDLTSRNGGWSRSGMLKYNELYLKVKDEQVADKGKFDTDYKPPTPG
jgi:hypothetical protein